jgi:hypothetical protein
MTLPRMARPQRWFMSADVAQPYLSVLECSPLLALLAEVRAGPAVVYMSRPFCAARFVSESLPVVF